jgi:hypothetical protein
MICFSLLQSEADPLAEFSSQLVEDWNKRREKDYQAIFKAFFSNQARFT